MNSFHKEKFFNFFWDKRLHF